MLSNTQINNFKNELLKLKKELTKTEEESDLKGSAQDEVGELSMYDNHPGDMGTELYERQKDLALNIHANDEVEKVDIALQAIQDGTYGRCEICDEEIPLERLEAIPYATRCKEHTTEQQIAHDRPSEKDILIMARPNSFADRRKGIARDSEDSFQEIAKSGTSETPSDFTEDHDDYNTLYDDKIMDGAAEEMEEFVSTDITGQSRGFVKSEISEEYEERLDDEGIESPLGDIPYHRKDSYLND
ncbi:TraR/DksA C4-type zinc finger protein [Sporosarcina contaminans]|uniref:TraR/DksA C4-type zinc finger protein n=1 Tax=Sporosarcina contaminans TaxID=633403 RepID=A0ABW3TYV1_9BACL